MRFVLGKGASVSEVCIREGGERGRGEGGKGRGERE